MNKEKHIEEMAKHCTFYDQGECYACANHPTECDLMCKIFGVFANLEMAGYRKVEGVAKEIFEEIGELVNEYLDGRIYTHDFCTYLAELKKKYTESKDE